MKNKVKLSQAMRSSFLVCVLSPFLLLGILGCRESEQGPAVKFEPNLLYAYQQAQECEVSMDAGVAQSEQCLEDLFGTPDEPRLPKIIEEDPELAKLVSLENLSLASGPAEDPTRGLYRRHCAICHGVSGNGRGATAALSNPYPRDYRMGKFKFKGDADRVQADEVRSRIRDRAWHRRNSDGQDCSGFVKRGSRGTDRLCHLLVVER